MMSFGLKSRTFAVLFGVAGMAVSACSGGGGGSSIPASPGTPSSTASAAAAGAPHYNGTPGPAASAAAAASASPTPSGTPTARAGLPTPTPTATPSATPSPTPTATSTATHAPTPTPAPTETVAAVAAVPYDPPAGSAPYFTSSIFAQRIPSPATVNSNSAAWIANAAQLGSFGIGNLMAYTSRAPNPSEIAFPVYLNHQGANMPVKIHCTKNYGGTAHPCNIEGLTVYVDPKELPQQGGLSSGSSVDAHWALIDPAAGYEYDTWNTAWPPQNGVLTVGWGGRCALSGDGFTNPSYAGPHWNSGCVADASGVPLSMGTIRVKDLLAAAADGGVLPRALNYAMGCPGPASGGALPAPFLGPGDGKCSGAAPEGSHLYLAMHDAQVNALGVAPILGVILRTLDEDHYGAYVIDSAGGASPVIGLNVESDQTYAAWGLPSPWLTQFVPEAKKEGLPTYTDSAHGRIGVQLPMPPAITWSQMRFM